MTMSEYYDKYQKRGAIHWDWYEKGTQTWYKIIVDKIIEYYRSLPSGTVLDIGCGDGLVDAKLASFHKVIGIDIDPIGIKLAREKTMRRNKKPTFFVMDFDNLPKIEQKSDYILFLNTIEHLKNPFKVLRQLIRMNKKLKNILIITDYPSDRPGRHHAQEFKPILLRNKCKSLNWKIARFETGVPEFHGIKLTRKK